MVIARRAKPANNITNRIWKWIKAGFKAILFRTNGSRDLVSSIKIREASAMTGNISLKGRNIHRKNNRDTEEIKMKIIAVQKAAFLWQIAAPQMNKMSPKERFSNRPAGGSTNIPVFIGSIVISARKIALGGLSSSPSFTN